MRIFNKKGKLISVEEYGKLASDAGYRVVKQETLPNGLFVSTVWLGLDHNFSGHGPAKTFETMVFPKAGDYGELDCRRYSTEAEALKGHVEIVEEYSKKGR